MVELPVETIPTDPEQMDPEPGTALCLSGGGYRAMVFHVGVLWRLYQAGLLSGIKRISSVSGGSNLENDFVPKVVRPLRALASETIDAEAVVFGIILPGRTSDRVAGAYDATLFNGAS